MPDRQWGVRPVFLLRLHKRTGVTACVQVGVLLPQPSMYREVTWIWLSQMYSITIQTQYVYCTFDIVQGGEVSWRRHSQSRPPCLRPLTERLHTTQCLSYWELQCTQTSLCCIFTARLLPYISTPLLQCTQVYLPHSARICTSVHPVYTCRILQGEACVRVYGLLRTAVGATRHAPYITLYIL
jgi:hypothetical protein